MRVLSYAALLGFVALAAAQNAKQEPPKFIDGEIEEVRIYLVAALVPGDADKPGEEVQQLMAGMRHRVSTKEGEAERVVYLPAAKSIAVYAWKSHHDGMTHFVNNSIRVTTNADEVKRLRIQYEKACQSGDAVEARKIGCRILELDAYHWKGSQKVEARTVNPPPILPTAFQPSLSAKDWAADPQFNLLKAEFEKTWKVSGPLEKK